MACETYWQAKPIRRQMHLRINGRVQGVSYRAYAAQKAQSLGLTGTVRNRTDGTVELAAEGDEVHLTTLLDWCWQGSPWAQVSAIDTRWSDATNEHTAFRVGPTH